MDLKTLLKQFTDENKLMQLATVVDNKPWICNVYFAADEGFNLYWSSARSRQHSKEIHANEKVAVSIVHDENEKQALQISGVAREVTLDDAARVHEIYCAKFGDKAERLEQVMKNEPEGRAYWVVEPTEIYFWDEVNFPDAPKQKYLG